MYLYIYTCPLTKINNRLKNVRAHGQHSLEHVSSIYSINTSLELKLTSKERMKDRGSTLSEWQAWVKKNEDRLKHPADYESKFVLQILAKIPGLCTSDVISQYAFVDRDGKNRRIDFVIRNKEKGWKLAIEVDGLTKLCKTKDSRTADYNSYDDFLFRQNSLVCEIPSLLRYTNMRFLNHEDSVIEEISERLEEQRKKHEEELEEIALIESLKKKDTNTDCVDNALEAVPESAVYRSESINGVSPSNSPSKQSKIFLWMASVFLIGLAFAYLSQNKTEQDFSSVPKTMETMSTVSNHIHNVNDASTDASVKSLNIRIPSGQARANLGRNAEVCGKLAQIVMKNHTVYLNFEKPFPYNDFTAVIKNIDSNKLIEFDEKIGKPLCVTGVIRLFGKKPGMFITKHF